MDPLVTGTVVQNLEASLQIRNSYFKAAIYAFVVITLVLLIDALNFVPLCVAMIAPLSVVGLTYFMGQQNGLEVNLVQLLLLYLGVALLVSLVLDFHKTIDVMLIQLPPVAGIFMMLGVFALLGVDLNPANLIVLPLILGIGVDDGVHVTHDYYQTASPYRISPSTINGVVLTSLTSIVGFGSLMFASHRGLVSLGTVLVIGVTTCMFASLVTLPAALTLIDRFRNPHTPHESGELVNSEDGEQPQTLALPVPPGRV